MSTLSRDQVEGMLTSLVQDKVDGMKVSRLLDHDLAQRDILRQREEEIAKRMSAWNKLRDGYDESIAQLQDQLAASHARCAQLEDDLARCRDINNPDERPPA